MHQIATRARADIPEPLPGLRLHHEDVYENERNRDGQGFVEFKGRIDDSVIIRIWGSEVFAEVVRGRPVQTEQLTLSGPLPTVGSFREFTVERKDGRGQVILLERPWYGNNHVAVIQISDPKGGSDRYRFRLIWKQ
jgi:hypothetical protein